MRNALRIENSIVFASSVAVFCIYYQLWAVHAGRDFETYISYFVQMWPDKPVDHLLMLYRTPGAPLFFGVLHKIGGVNLVAVGLCLLYGVGNTLFYDVIRRSWNRVEAIVWLCIIFLLSLYNWTYHTVASESLYCFSIMLLSWGLFKAFEGQTLKRWIFVGIAVVIAVMIRPGSLVLIVLCASPLAAPLDTLKKKMQYSLIMVVTISIPLFIYSSINYVRYGDFVVTRGSNTLIPAFRCFLLDHSMKESNGPASEKLALLISENILPTQMYQKYNVDIDLFFASGDPCMFYDLVNVSDRVYGWDSNYAVIKDAAMEAVKADPWGYLGSVGRTLRVVFSESELSLGQRNREEWPNTPLRDQRTRMLRAQGLSVPDYGQLLPASLTYWLSSGSGFLKFTEADVNRVRERTQHIVREYPTLEQVIRIPGHSILRGVWVFLAHVTSKMYLFLFAGLAVFFFNDWKSRCLSCLLFAFLLLLVVTFSGADAVPQMRTPFDPLFVLAGLNTLGNIAHHLRHRLS